MIQQSTQVRILSSAAATALCCSSSLAQTAEADADQPRDAQAISMVTVTERTAPIWNLDVAIDQARDQERSGNTSTASASTFLNGTHEQSHALPLLMQPAEIVDQRRSSVLLEEKPTGRLIMNGVHAQFMSHHPSLMLGARTVPTSGSMALAAFAAIVVLKKRRLSDAQHPQDA